MESADLGTAITIFVILSLLFIGGILFLIIYGLVKKKRVLWITGVAVGVVSMFLWVFTYCRAYDRTAQITDETKENADVGP
jgi:hypothetical protein